MQHDYQVVISATQYDLTRDVKAHQTAGWIVVGGFFVAMSNGAALRYYQPMIKDGIHDSASSKKG